MDSGILMELSFVDSSYNSIIAHTTQSLKLWLDIRHFLTKYDKCLRHFVRSKDIFCFKHFPYVWTNFLNV